MRARACGGGVRRRESETQKAEFGVALMSCCEPLTQPAKWRCRDLAEQQNLEVSGENKRKCQSCMGAQHSLGIWREAYSLGASKIAPILTHPITLPSRSPRTHPFPSSPRDSPARLHHPTHPVPRLAFITSRGNPTVLGRSKTRWLLCSRPPRSFCAPLLAFHAPAAALPCDATPPRRGSSATAG